VGFVCSKDSIYNLLPLMGFQDGLGTNERWLVVERVKQIKFPQGILRLGYYVEYHPAIYLGGFLLLEFIQN